MTENPRVSIVVPFFNEEESIPPLVQAVRDALDPVGITFELVAVDDGSSDRTHEVLAAEHEKDPRVRVLKLRRNYGQTPAMAAGCASEYPVFEDRSDEVELRHRIPSK